IERPHARRRRYQVAELIRRLDEAFGGTGAELLHVFADAGRLFVDDETLRRAAPVDDETFRQARHHSTQLPSVASRSFLAVSGLVGGRPVKPGAPPAPGVGGGGAPSGRPLMCERMRLRTASGAASAAAISSCI